MSTVIEREPEQATLPACLLHENSNGLDRPRRIWSLLDLLQVYAAKYVQIGRMYQDYLHGFHSTLTRKDTMPNQEQYAHTLAAFNDIYQICKDTQLTVSARSIDRAIEEMTQKTPTFGEAQQHLESWFKCFTAELETQQFFLVLPYLSPYLPPSRDSEPVPRSPFNSLMARLKSFPDARHDAFEAGCCIALRRFSAGVYHLMRVAEHGLVSVAADLNVPDEKLSKGWDGCLTGIQSGINLISSTKPTTDWQSDVKKYSDLCTWFISMKSGWRNPVSHVPRIYSEESALGIFAVTTSLFDHLTRYGFKQTTMPHDPLPLP